MMPLVLSPYMGNIWTGLRGQLETLVDTLSTQVQQPRGDRPDEVFRSDVVFFRRDSKIGGSELDIF